jgi:hypothetical protein
MAGAQKQQSDRLPGLGVAAWFLILAAMFVFAPRFFDAYGWQRAIWNGFGVLFGVIALLGALIELERMTSRRIMRGVIAGTVLTLIALGAYLIVREYSPPSPWTGMLEVIAFAFAALAPLGFIESIGRAVEARRLSGQAASRGEREHSLIVFVVGLLGFATAAANLARAIVGS